MIIKKYFNPQLTVAISILAASGCFAAIPNYQYQQQRAVQYRTAPSETQTVPINSIMPSKSASRPVPLYRSSTPLPSQDQSSPAGDMEETHRKMTTKVVPAVQETTSDLPHKIVPPVNGEGSTGLKAEDYKKRLLAIKESYSTIAERTLQAQSQADDDDDDDDDEEDDDDDDSSGKNVVAIADSIRKTQYLAISSPYGEQGYDEEKQDWGNASDSKPQTEPTPVDTKEPKIESLPGDDGYEFKDEEGFLVDGSVSQIQQGRREGSRDIREATRVPANAANSSTINTDRIRRSRVPKSSVQSQRQREATNSLRTRLADSEEPLYYEDYLASISDHYEETQKPDATPERKPYTKPRRRPVSQDKDQTAIVNVVPSQRVSTRTSRNHLKDRDAQNAADDQDDLQSKREARRNKILRDRTREDARQEIKKPQADEKYLDKTASPPVRTQVKPLPISVKNLSVHQPQIQTAKTYIPSHQSIKSQPIAVQAPTADDDEEGEEDDADLTTDRGDRPNWYDRMDAQRRERSIQRRVRALDGQNPQPRGYPTIPEYTQGNTTPKS